MKILFVCEANICRSAMAEAYAKHLIKINFLVGSARSAGVKALEGRPMSDLGKAALKKNKVRRHTHKAQQLSIQHIKQYDYILTMTKTQKLLALVVIADEVEKENRLSQKMKSPAKVESSKKRIEKLKEFESKIFTLGEFVGEEVEVSDPYGYSEDSYQFTFMIIAPLVEKVIKKIIGYDINIR